MVLVVTNSMDGSFHSKSLRQNAGLAGPSGVKTATADL